MAESPNPTLDPNAAFYREQVWQFMTNELNTLRTDLRAVQNSVDRIERKLNWMVGWAIGAAAAISFIWSYLKEKIIRI